MLIKIEGGKTNFIDRNDNFVGYDDQYTSCCENPYWEFEDWNGNSLGVDVDPGIEGLEFLGKIDTSDYHSVKFPCTSGYTLILRNIQNGYYSHFWECTMDGEHQEGSI